MVEDISLQGWLRTKEAGLGSEADGGFHKFGNEEDFRPQKANTKRGWTSGQMWKVDFGKEWISSEHQVTGKQVTSDPLEKSKTRNTIRP